MHTAPGFSSPVFPAAPPPLTAAPASPFALAPERDDTALYRDLRSGFSHLLPGRPVLGTSRTLHGELPVDVVLNLRDAPLAIQYRCEPPAFAATSAAEVAKGTAERIAGFRAHAAIAVDFANPTWLEAWAVEAAAVASYDVAGSQDHEDLFVLVRQGLVMTVRWTYPRGFLDDPAYATFASVAEATMVWDAQRWDQHGRIWPDSALAGPGLYGQAKAKYVEPAKALRAAPSDPATRAHFLNVLSAVVSSAGAPWVVLAAPVREANRRTILAAAPNDATRAFVEHAFADVKTAHDLRGLAVVLGRAI